MDQSLFWNLLAKKIAGEASPEELKEFEKLTKLNPDWAYQAEHVQHFWHPGIDTDKIEAEAAFEQHLKKMKESGIDFPDSNKIAEAPVISRRHQSRNKYYRFAIATIVIFLIIAIGWLRNENQTTVPAQKTYSEVSSPIKSKTKLVLPDSSVVWLNAGSKLTYNEGFGVSNRNTSLMGEAYFDVKKSSVPFIIHANNIQIKVLGTAFNVKAYPGEKTTETSLVRGRVEVSIDKRPGAPIVLRPNEKLVVANEVAEVKTKLQKPESIIELKKLTRTEDSTIIETSWVDNKLIFQDETFQDIARKIERWYGVSIEFKDERVANERLSGTFTNENVQEALNALQFATKFHYYTKGNVITITH